MPKKFLLKILSAPELLTLATLLLLSTSYFLRGHNMTLPSHTIQLDGATVNVDITALRELRASLIAYLELHYSGNAEVVSLLNELETSQITLEGESPIIGSWSLTEWDGSPALVRIPPRTRTNRTYVADIGRKNGIWFVRKFSFYTIRGVAQPK